MIHFLDSRDCWLFSAHQCCRSCLATGHNRRYPRRSTSASTESCNFFPAVLWESPRQNYLLLASCLSEARTQSVGRMTFKGLSCCHRWPCCGKR